MSSYSYINCPYCSFLFKFTQEHSKEDEGSTILTCPSCYQEFGITSGPPLNIEDLVENPVNLFGGVTAPVDNDPLFRNVGLPIIHVEKSSEILFESESSPSDDSTE